MSATEDAARSALFAGRKASAEDDNPYSHAPESKEPQVVSTELDDDDQNKAMLLAGAAERVAPVAAPDDSWDQGTFDLDLGDIDITTEDIDFDEIDEDLARFQQDATVKDALLRGVDLRQYSREIDLELREVTVSSITDYIAEADNVASIYRQIEECDSVLEGMQQLLHGFQADLGGISDEIRHLQDQSLEMNVKMRNRKTVKGALGEFVEGVVVPDTLVVGICEGQVNDAFLEYLLALDGKSQYIRRTQNLTATVASSTGAGNEGEESAPTTASAAAAAPAEGEGAAATSAADGASEPAGDGENKAGEQGSGSGDGDGEAAAAAATAPAPAPAPAPEVLDLGVAPVDTAAAAEMAPVVERLRRKAVVRVREFLLHHIASLKAAHTNVQGVQRNVLLRFRYFVPFLEAHGAAALEEVRRAYVATVEGLVFSTFKSYYSALLRQRRVVAGKGTLLAVEEAPKGFFARMSAGRRLSGVGTGGGGGGGGGAGAAAGGGGGEGEEAAPFVLGERQAVLDDPDAPALLTHILKAENTQLPFEALFRSWQKHLCDTVSTEFQFTFDFFGRKQHTQLFRALFDRTLSFALTKLTAFAGSCHDVLTLLLLIRVTHSHRLTMMRRRVPSMDTYFDRLNLLLWPRFKACCDAQHASVRNADAAKLGGGGGGGGGGAGAVSAAVPHAVTRRYAEYVSSLSLLLAGMGDGGAATMSDEMVVRGLDRLRADVQALLQRLAALLPGGAKARTVFALNNYCHLLTVFTRRGLDRDGADVTAAQAQLSSAVDAFIETQLAEIFGSLIQYVRRTEAALAAAGAGAGAAAGAGGGGGPPRGVDVGEMERLVRSFASNWKSGIEMLNASVMKHVSDFRNGMDILKKLLTQLLLYYTRFQEIIKTCFPRPPPFASDIVSIQTIMVEIKNYSRAV